MRRHAAALSLAILVAAPSYARVLVGQDEALRSAFPGAELRRETVFLKPHQVERARQTSGVDVESQLVIRYVATAGGRTVGWAYFDTHRVRTLQETLMIVVSPDSTISRIEITSFREPPDYLPKRRWLDQLHGQRLGSELSLERAVRPITGATLSGRAVVNASRRMLAVHEAIEAERRARAAGGAEGR
jgi:hypothetical protein